LIPTTLLRVLCTTKICHRLTLALALLQRNKKPLNRHNHANTWPIVCSLGRQRSHKASLSPHVLCESQHSGHRKCGITVVPYRRIEIVVLRASRTGEPSPRVYVPGQADEPHTAIRLAPRCAAYCASNHTVYELLTARDCFSTNRSSQVPSQDRTPVGPFCCLRLKYARSPSRPPTSPLAALPAL
jgi:hypothetical protein